MTIELIDTGAGDLKEDFRKNLDRLITSRTYETYENGCHVLGTSDLVVVINGDAPEDALSRRGYVFKREELASDEKFPLGIRERLKERPQPSTLMLGTRTFWAIVLWNKSVAALVITIKEMTQGGDA